MKVLIPVSSDETATAYCDPIGEYIEGQDGATIENIRALATANDVDSSGLETMTPEERYEFLAEDVGYYTFDELVVIDEKHLPVLERLSNLALDNGSDGTLYAACEMYNEAVRALGEKVISFFGEHIQECDY